MEYAAAIKVRVNVFMIVVYMLLFIKGIVSAGRTRRMKVTVEWMGDRYREPYDEAYLGADLWDAVAGFMEQNPDKSHGSATKADMPSEEPGKDYE